MNSALKFILGLSILGVVACSDSGTESNDKTSVSDGKVSSGTAKDIDDLAKCTNELADNVVFVESENQNYRCNGRSWKIIEDKGEVDNKDGKDEDTKTSSASKESSSSKSSSSTKDALSSESSSSAKNSDNADNTSSGNNSSETKSSSSSTNKDDIQEKSSSSKKNEISEKSSSSTVSSASSNSSAKVDEIANEISDAEACSATNVGWTIYIQEESQYYKCTESGYVEIDAPKSSSSKGSITVSSSSTDFEIIDFKTKTITDNRDNHDYELIRIGTQLWMKTNLNYASEGGNADDAVASWCYDDKPSNCKTLGRLYTWAAAMNSTNDKNLNKSGLTAGAQGICPDGLHIPTVSEWETLISYLSSNSKTLVDYDFDLQPAGKYDQFNSGDFSGTTGTQPTLYMWTSNEKEGGTASAYYNRTSNGIAATNDYKINALSVRCVADVRGTCNSDAIHTFREVEENVYECKKAGTWDLVTGQDLISFRLGKTCTEDNVNDYAVRNDTIYSCLKKYVSNGSSGLSEIYRWEDNTLKMIQKENDKHECNEGETYISEITGKTNHCYHGEWVLACTDTSIACQNLSSIDVSHGIYALELNYSAHLNGGTFLNDESASARYVTPPKRLLLFVNGSISVEYYSSTYVPFKADDITEECIEGEIIVGKVSNTFYYCHDGKWEDADNAKIAQIEMENETGTYAELKAGSKTGNTYYYDFNGWRMADSSDIPVTSLGDCSKANSNETHIVNNVVYYCYYDSTKYWYPEEEIVITEEWREKTGLDLVNYYLRYQECNSTFTFEDKVYYCMENVFRDKYWHAENDMAKDTYGITCKNGEIVQGQANKDNYYYCDNDKWIDLPCYNKKNCEVSRMESIFFTAGTYSISPSESSFYVTCNAGHTVIIDGKEVCSKGNSYCGLNISSSTFTIKFDENTSCTF